MDIQNSSQTYPTTFTNGNLTKQVCIDGDSTSIEQISFGIKSILCLEKDGVSYATHRSLPNNGVYSLQNQTQACSETDGIGVNVRIVTSLNPVFLVEGKKFVNQEHLRLFLKQFNFKCLQESGKVGYVDHIEELVNGGYYLGIANTKLNKIISGLGARFPVQHDLTFLPFFICLNIVIFFSYINFCRI